MRFLGGKDKSSKVRLISYVLVNVRLDDDDVIAIRGIVDGRNDVIAFLGVVIFFLGFVFFREGMFDSIAFLSLVDLDLGVGLGLSSSSSKSSLLIF